MQLHAFSKGTRTDLAALRKSFTIMKAISVLILVFCFQASAKTYSQEITLSLNNVPLEKVFKEIQEQADYHFIYTREQVALAKKVSLSVKNEKLETVLRICFKDQPLTYTIEGDVVAVFMKEKQNELSSFLPIKGRIINENGEGVIATISIKGSNVSVSSDANGYFEIKNADQDATLLIAGVNIEDYEIKIKGREDLGIISVRLKIVEGENVEVMSTGYQQLPKERATGSFSQPDKKMFNSRVSTDVLSKLEGITNGILFNTPGITGSRDAQISIRGRSTIFANSQPLVIVNNFPYEGDVRNINPNDVETITILKDAAAVSIWGVRAGNGVIIITTKQGKFDQPLQISFNSNITVSKKPDLFYDPNFLNSSDFIDVEMSLFSQNLYNGAINNGYGEISPVVDILRQKRSGLITDAEATSRIDSLRKFDIRNDLEKYFYRGAINQQYSLQFHGGSTKNSYFFSLGYDKNLLSLRENSFDRVTINATNTFALLKGLSFSAGINYVESNSESDNTASSLMNAFKGRIYPYAQVADGSGNYLSVVSRYSPLFTQNAPSNGYLDWKFYPLNELKEGLNETKAKGYDLRVTGSLHYTIINGLSAEVKYQYQHYVTDSRNLASAESFYARNFINMYSVVNTNGKVTGYNIKPGGIISLSNSMIASNNFRGNLTYSKNFGRHALSAIAGAEVRETTGENNNSIHYGYDESTGTFQNVNSTSSFVINPSGNSSTISTGSIALKRTIDRFRSYFGNASYVYNSKYIFSISGRIDGSNYFGVKTNQKNVPLWSTGVKWDLNKENFYRVKWLPVLKLRMSFGYSGNLDQTVTAVTTFRYFDFTSQLSNLRYAQISNLGNPELRWEKMGILNFGVDFGLRNNIVQGSIEYYQKRGKDMMGDAIVDPTAGVTQFRGNFSNMSGKGIDINLTTININKNVKWLSTIIFNWNTDKVTKYDGKIFPSNLIGADKNLYPHSGYPVFGIYSYQWGGLDSTGAPQGYDSQKQLSKNYSMLVNPSTFDELVYHGPGRPVFFGGLINYFTYKGFELSVGINYKLHYFFRARSINYRDLYVSAIGHKDFLNRWQQPGDEFITNVPSMPRLAGFNANRDLFYGASEVNVKKGDHIRLQDINIGYTVSKNQSIKLPFESLQFYINLNNVGIIWKANKDGLDPDYPSGFPIPRSVSFGVKSNF